MGQILQQRRTVNSKLRGKIARYAHTTPPAPKQDMYFAGFWMRLWAFLLDTVIVFSLNGMLVFPLLRWNDAHFIKIGPFAIETLLTATVFFLYFAIMTKYYGQTIGKMVFGLRVVNSHGKMLSWGQILFREGVGRLLHQTFFILNALYVTVAFTEKKQGIHDMIADSYVVSERG